MSLAFLDFYRKNNISPVAQDIRDLERHYGRREALYRLLGIAPQALRDRDVIELCPGSGYNSIYTMSLAPRSYTLVDGNPTGLEQAKALFAQYHPGAAGVEFFLSLINEYQTKRTFDFVFCESAIPFQNDPQAFARDLCRFLAPGGILVLTCVDAVSFIGEASRRLLAARYADPAAPVADRLEKLRPVFASHLAALPGASRPIDDWILDNIIHPIRGAFFSIADAVKTLDGQGLEFYGSSPDFLTDWRWYKDIVPGKALWNDRMCESYMRNTLNFMDCRYVRPEQSVEFGLRLTSYCDTLWAHIRDFEDGDTGAYAAAVETLQALGNFVAPAAPQTAQSLNELIAALAQPAVGMPHLPNFCSLFGRATQYVSFLKKG